MGWSHILWCVHYLRGTFPTYLCSRGLQGSSQEDFKRVLLYGQASTSKLIDPPLYHIKGKSVMKAYWTDMPAIAGENAGLCFNSVMGAYPWVLEFTTDTHFDLCHTYV